MEIKWNVDISEYSQLCNVITELMNSIYSSKKGIVTRRENDRQKACGSQHFYIYGYRDFLKYMLISFLRVSIQPEDNVIHSRVLLSNLLVHNLLFSSVIKPQLRCRSKLSSLTFVTRLYIIL